MTDDEGSDAGRSADGSAASEGSGRGGSDADGDPRVDDVADDAVSRSTDADRDATAEYDPDAEGEEPDVPVGAAESRKRDRPRPQPGASTTGSQSFLTRFRTAQSGPLLFVRETLYSAAAVLAVGFLLFAISGVWPPMVAVESGSMEPQMQRGDLIFVTEPQRFTPDYAYGDTGVVTVEIGDERGYRSFGGNGSVVIYDPPTRRGSPIIHRAHFFVEDGENWYDEANPSYMSAGDCEQLANCPAPHAGFITKGDANGRYDQASDIAGPVRPEWIRGTARFRVPYLGYVRLKLAGALAA